MNAQIIAVPTRNSASVKRPQANLGIGCAQGRKALVMLMDADSRPASLSLGTAAMTSCLSPVRRDGPYLDGRDDKPGEGILEHPEAMDLMPADIQLPAWSVAGERHEPREHSAAVWIP